MTHIAARPNVRLAEILGVLSLATDLGMGQPLEHILRQCVISLRLADRLGLATPDREALYLRRAAGLGRLPRGRARAGEVVLR